MASNATVGSGIGLPTLLTILFIGLKLTGHITWSWLWVLAPLWLFPVAVLTVLLGIGLAALLFVVVVAIIEK